MTSDCLFDCSGIFAQPSGNEREINLLDRALLELRGQSAVRLVVFRNDQAAARLFIKPMHYSRPFFPADSGKFRKMMKERIHQGVLALSGTGMNNESCLFVDYDQIFVFVQNFERDRFRLIVDLLRWRLVYLNAIAASYEIARPGGGAV